MSAIKFRDPFSTPRSAKTWNGDNASSSVTPRTRQSSQQSIWRKGTSVLITPIRALTRSNIGIQRHLTQPSQSNDEILPSANLDSLGNCQQPLRNRPTANSSLIDEPDWIEVVARAFTFSNTDDDSNEPSAEERLRFYSRDSITTIPLDDFVSKRQFSTTSGGELKVLPLSGSASLVVQERRLLRMMHRSLDGEEGNVENNGEARKSRSTSDGATKDYRRCGSEESKPRRESSRSNFRDYFSAQIGPGGLFSKRRARLSGSDHSGSPGSPGSPGSQGSAGSPKLQDSSTPFHMHMPSFGSGRVTPRIFTPLLSPRSDPSTQTPGFFDAVAAEKTLMAAGSAHLGREFPIVPVSPPHSRRRQEDYFRKSVLGQHERTDEEMVQELPDHLPSSPLCPKHPKNKLTRGRGRCPVHGRNRLSLDSLSEEEEPVMRHKKDLNLIL